jgi:hypothetical protein
MSTGSRNRRWHRGVDFSIWGSEGAWFLVNPRGMGGMVGASTNKAQAVREACMSIEELLSSLSW